MNKQNQGVKLEEKTKELFLHAKQVVNKGIIGLCSNHYQGTLQGVTYSVDLHMYMGFDNVSVSTDSWCIDLSNHMGLEGNREYRVYARKRNMKGEVPENLNEILIALKSVPNEKRPKGD